MTLVWLIRGEKAGDNAQLDVVGDALAARLGWTVLSRQVQMLPQWVQGKPKVERSLHHIDRGKSDPLEPPWPDLAITIGRRPSMVALWIKQEKQPALRIVRIGKPTGNAELFDLVIASAGIQVAPQPHVLRIGLPLMRPDLARVAAAAADWRTAFAALPKPVIGFLIGGPTGPYRFGPSVLTRLQDLVLHTHARGGTPWITTSRRTPASAADALARALPEGARYYRWSKDAPHNPYLGLLGLADGFVVTGDSISMITEVARLGRPLQILPLAFTTMGRFDLARRRVATALFSRAHRPGWRDAARLATRAGLSTQTRDFESFYAMLLERGIASPLGGPFTTPTDRPDDDLDRVVERVTALVHGRSEILQ